MKRFVFLLFVAILGGIAAIALVRLTEDKKPGRHLTLESAPVRPVSSFQPGVNGPDFVGAADKTIHAVVHIKTEYQQKSSIYDFFFRDFFEINPQGRGRPYVATGSGVIISPDGYIVTNNHVVQDADYIEVTLNDRRTFEAKLIGNDPSTDIALIKVEEKELPYLVFGNSDMVKVGEWVLAVGNPFNLTSTVTAGIVSAKARNINILGDKSAIESFIQTDAAVNPGNSGGALVNTMGDLIGINAAIASNTGSYTGYSFAIPSNLARKVVEDLRDYGATQRGYLGINPADVTSELAREKGISDVKGVYVYRLVEEGSAREAGLEQGDIIVSINDIPVNSISEMNEIVGQFRPGDKVKVGYERKGKSNTAMVTLRNKDGSFALVKRKEVDVLQMLGASFTDVGETDKSRLRIEHGVKVSELTDGLLSRAGIRNNFIIMYIDKNKVRETSDIEKILSGKKGGVLLEGIYPNRMRAYYLVVLK